MGANVDIDRSWCTLQTSCVRREHVPRRCGQVRLYHCTSCALTTHAQPLRCAEVQFEYGTFLAQVYDVEHSAQRV